jgi:hypothetical protein
MNLIDFREHDSHEHGLTMTQRITEVTIDLQLAQRIRDGLRKQGLIPLTEAEAFAEADKRMRSRA